MTTVSSGEVTLSDVMDGKSLYTWIRYADDEKGTGMSESSEGKRYLGISTNQESETPSNDPTLYKWTKLYNNGKSSAKNYLSGTDIPFEWDVDNTEGDNVCYPNNVYTTVKSKTLSELGFKEKDPVLLGFTIQIADKQVYNGSWRFAFTNEGVETFDSGYTTFKESSIPKSVYHTEEGDIWFLFIADETILKSTAFKVCIKDEIKGKLVITNCRLNKSELDLGWQLAEEDVVDQLANKASKNETNFQLSNLKSQGENIQKQLEEMHYVETVAQWRLQFDNLVKNIEEGKVISQNDLRSLGERMQGEYQQLQDKVVQYDFITRYFRVGEEGLEISSVDGSSTILINDKRISMITNNNNNNNNNNQEVMYLEAGTFNINNGILSMSCRIGHYYEYVDPNDENTNLIMFVGQNG